MVSKRLIPGGTRRRIPVLAALPAALLLVALWLLPACAGQAACPSVYFRGAAPEIRNPKAAAETRELCYSAFGVVHSGVTRTPLWSAEHLTRDHLSAAKELVRRDSFHAEERLPPRERAELHDYSRSGFDRGHLAPNGDMPDPRAQHESFSLANIVPQDPESNRGVWQGIESAVRELARRRGELYVVTGPLFRGATLGRVGGRVMVPTHLFKAVYDPAAGKGAAYLVENGPTRAYATVSLAELETLAGIDLFPALSAPEKREELSLPKPARQGGRRGKGRGRDDAAEAVWWELKSLLR